MTKQEFTKLYCDITGCTVSESYFTDEAYKAIEFVYMYHPSISDTNGKIQIVNIFVYGGLPVIYDMLPRAKKAQVVELAIHSANSRLADLKELYVTIQNDENYTESVERLLSTQ